MTASSQPELVFLKLGGSLVTDKAATVATPRPALIERIATEIRTALDERPNLRLVVGHGSGSYGHQAADQFGTHTGVHSRADWRGFAEVAAVAARLNSLVLEALHAAGLPVFRVQPSASAVCEDGRVISMALEPLLAALDGGLVPLVYGDVAVDRVRGGTIISTETVLTAIAQAAPPRRILLAGDFDGVEDAEGRIVPLITPSTFPALRSALGGSAQTDVTGGMAAKVESMLALCQSAPGLDVHIFNGAPANAVRAALLGDASAGGTHITAEEGTG